MKALGNRRHRRALKKAFENNDVEWVARYARSQSEGAYEDPRVVLYGFHKARYEHTGVSAKKRRESQKWLADRGLKRYGGEPVRHGDPLPV